MGVKCQQASIMVPQPQILILFKLHLKPYQVSSGLYCPSNLRVLDISAVDYRVIATWEKVHLFRKLLMFGWDRLCSFFALQEKSWGVGERGGRERESERECRMGLQWTIVLTAFLTNDECASEVQEAASFCFCISCTLFSWQHPESPSPCNRPPSAGWLQSEDAIRADSTVITHAN